jgi:hypothetical protein
VTHTPTPAPDDSSDRGDHDHTGGTGSPDVGRARPDGVNEAERRYGVDENPG